VTNQRLIHALIESDNEAADELLLEALGRGNEAEKSIALGALLQRQRLRGLSGVVAQYPQLTERLQLIVLNSIKQFHSA
jgi:hypothetical protein